MRRALAISLAILVVALSTSGVVAQDAEQSVSDRLLEILKDRQIISQSEYGELKDLASKMDEERSEMDSRLGALDRSISEYLAKDGAAVGSNVTYHPGKGFTFSSSNNLFSLSIGGTFIFQYLGLDVDNAPNVNDTNNFNITENRIIFQGHAFDPNLSFYIELNAVPERSSAFGFDIPDDYFDGMYDGYYGGINIWEAYVNYNICDWAEVRFGQMKVPYGRQWMTHVSDLEFANRDFVTDVFALGTDVGVMFHDVVKVQEGGDAAIQYNLGFWNGEGNSGNDSSWLAWAIRFGVDPLGYVDYVEGDPMHTKAPKFSIAGTYYSNHMKNQNLELEAWEIDGVFKWMGFWLTAEYFSRKYDFESSPNATNDGWYVQAGYYIMPEELEAIGRYGQVDWDSDSFAGNFGDLDQTWSWALGLAYYWSGHNWKVLTEFGQMTNDVDGSSDVDAWFFRVAFQLEW
jgi:hypothetical protein